MSNDSNSTVAVEPRMVALARINVAEDHNPRTDLAAYELAELVESIRTHGVITPVLLSPDEQVEGEFRLVAGERRYRAACEAGLTEIPALVRPTADGDALDLAVVENLHRQDLNPVDEARAYQRALQGDGLTQAKLAERLAVKPRRISGALRLLRLPEAVQEHIAAGRVPVSCTKALEEIAKVSPPVAAAVCGLLAAGEADPAQLEHEPTRLVRHVAASNDELVCVPIEPYMAYDAIELPLPEDQAQEIADRAAALPTGQLAVRFSDEDADAARAYGCLLELDAGAYMAAAFICDPVFLADRVRLALEQTEQLAEEQAARQPDKPGSDTDASGYAEPRDADEVAHERKQRSEAERQDRIDARGANLTLGARLAEEFHEPKLTRDVAQLVAVCVLDRDTASLAAAGLRYVREEWQEDQSRTLKSGEQREKIAYLEPAEAEAAMWEWFDKARTPEQMIGRVVQALIAAHHADDSAVAQSNRSYYSLPGRYGGGPATRVPELVEKLAKRVLPPRLAGQLAEAQAQRAKWARDDDQD